MTGTKPRSSHRRTRGSAPSGNRSEPSVPTRRIGGSSLRMDRVLLLAAIGTGIILLGILLARLFSRSQAPQPAPVAADASRVEPLGPVLDQAIPQQAQAPTSATLDESSAATLIENWLSAKAAAMGEEHAIGELSTILAEPALSGWQERAEQSQASNSYWQYEHSNVEVTSVEMLSADTPDATSPETAETEASDSESSTATSPTDASPTDASSTDASPTDNSGENNSSEASGDSAAIVDATVTEQGSFYSNGQLDESSSYDDSLQVRYTLVRENEQWLIQDWEVLE